ncbi:MAG: ATP-binding protein [Acidimicrobiales bacterium]
MRMTFELELPRDVISIPITRHLARNAMRAVGVADDCVGDVELALTEACTNVLDHAGPADAYAVHLTIDGPTCSIRIVDVGDGFDALGAGTVPAEPGAETGRGIALMRALMDQVRFESGPEAGTVVHLHKQLVFADDAPLVGPSAGEVPDT